MGFLPLRTVALASPLPPAALAGRLRRAIGDAPGQPFAGTVTTSGFVITRLRAYRSTFMPVLSGRLGPAPDGGTLVRLRLTPPGVVILFMGIWLSFLAAVAALIVAAPALGGGRSPAWLLAPAGLAGLSWHVMASVFAADAGWALEHLREQLPELTSGCAGTPRGAELAGDSRIYGRDGESMRR